MLTCGIPQSEGGVCRKRCAVHGCIDGASPEGSEARGVVPQRLFEDHVQIWELGLIDSSNRVCVRHACVDLGTQTTQDVGTAELKFTEILVSFHVSHSLGWYEVVLQLPKVKMTWCVQSGLLRQPRTPLPINTLAR